MVALSTAAACLRWAWLSGPHSLVLDLEGRTQNSLNTVVCAHGYVFLGLNPQSSFGPQWFL